MTTAALVAGWLCLLSAVVVSIAGGLHDYLGNSGRAHELQLRAIGWTAAAALMWLVAK